MRKNVCKYAMYNTRVYCICVYTKYNICKMCGNTCVLCCVEIYISIVWKYMYIVYVCIQNTNHMYVVWKHMCVVWKYMLIVWNYEHIVYVCIQDTKYGYLCGNIQYMYVVCVYIHEQTHTRTPQQRV